MYQMNNVVSFVYYGCLRGLRASLIRRSSDDNFLTRVYSPIPASWAGRSSSVAQARPLYPRWIEKGEYQISDATDGFRDSVPAVLRSGDIRI